jgi:hypothetical protein
VVRLQWSFAALAAVVLVAACAGVDYGPAPSCSSASTCGPAEACIDGRCTAAATPGAGDADGDGIPNGEDPDADGDGIGDDPDDDDPDDVPPEPKPTLVSVTSGGGTASSARFVLEARIGAPQPMGGATSSGFRLSMGPLTLR